MGQYRAMLRIIFQSGYIWQKAPPLSFFRNTMANKNDYYCLFPTFEKKRDIFSQKIDNKFLVSNAYQTSASMPRRKM